jgi:hypothetical protein
VVVLLGILSASVTGLHGLPSDGKWALLRDGLTTVKLFNMDVAGLMPECFLGWTYPGFGDRFWLQLLWIALCLGPACLATALRLVAGSVFGHTPSASFVRISPTTAVRIFAAAADMSVLHLLEMSFSTFSCVAFGGTWRLAVAPGEMCWSASHLPTFCTAVILVVLLTGSVLAVCGGIRLVSDRLHKEASWQHSLLRSARFAYGIDGADGDRACWVFVASGLALRVVLALLPIFEALSPAPFAVRVSILGLCVVSLTLMIARRPPFCRRHLNVALGCWLLLLLGCSSAAHYLPQVAPALTIAVICCVLLMVPASFIAFLAYGRAMQTNSAERKGSTSLADREPAYSSPMDPALPGNPEPTPRKLCEHCGEYGRDHSSCLLSHELQLELFC